MIELQVVTDSQKQEQTPLPTFKLPRAFFASRIYLFRRPHL